MTSCHKDVAQRLPSSKGADQAWADQTLMTIIGTNLINNAQETDYLPTTVIKQSLLCFGPHAKRQQLSNQVSTTPAMIGTSN